MKRLLTRSLNAKIFFKNFKLFLKVVFRQIIEYLFNLTVIFSFPEASKLRMFSRDKKLTSSLLGFFDLGEVQSLIFLVSRLLRRTYERSHHQLSGGASQHIPRILAERRRRCKPLNIGFG